MAVSGKVWIPKNPRKETSNPRFANARVMNSFNISGNGLCKFESWLIKLVASRPCSANPCKNR